MTSELGKRPERLVLEDLLVPNWDPTNTRGFDLAQLDDSQPDYIPHGTSIDRVGEGFPSLVVSFSNETVAGTSGYSYLGGGSPAQNRDGSVVATLRAQATADGGYTADSATYSAVEAAEILHEFEEEIGRITQANPDGGSTELYSLASFPAGQAPDDRDEVPPVRLRSVAITYNWINE